MKQGAGRIARTGLERVLLAFACLVLGTAAHAQRLDPARIKQDVRVLSSDAFEGRGPAQASEPKVVAYIAKQMQAAGLQPAGPNGSWYQDVPMTRLTRGPATVTARVRGAAVQLRAGQEVTVAPTGAGRTQIADAPLLFGGYGVADAKLGWDPFAGVDVRGKVVVVLWGDPDLEAGRDGGFGGRALTLAGRSGSKFAPLRARGALGMIVVHEDYAASYPWSQVANGDAVPTYALDSGAAAPGGGASLRMSMRRDVAVDLLRRAGLNYADLKRRSQTRAFRAVPIGNATISADFIATADKVVSRNVVGVLPGTTRAAETVVYGAHWDAYGRNAFDPPADRTRNGAIDNATGTATMLEIARAFAAGPRPQRSVLFAAWTAEEKGLLGATWYANNPLRPLETTAAAFNLDPHVVLDAARNLDLVGPGRTPLEADLKRVARANGLRVDDEVNTEAGWYFRSDHYAFAEKGVPTVYFRAGTDLRRGGRAAGERIKAAYNARCYHQTCDEFDPGWTMAGAAQEGQVAFEMGREIANGGRWPGWNAGNPFAAVRESSAASRR
jgi:Zn-dependent M28 family amino/carboxypeptidase